MRHLLAALALSAGALSFASAASADEHAAAPAHGEPAVAAHAEHGDDHAISLDDFNWYYGLIAEKEGVEPGLWFRPKGMPVPFAALVLDSLILYYILYRALGKTVRNGLTKRKQTIMRGMEDASKMRREAEEQLASYEEKLSQISSDIARIKRQMRHVAETEGARILTEAKERRGQMERDAEQLVQAELKATRERLMAELMENALESAEARLIKRIGEGDQLGFADEYVRSLPTAAAVLRGRV
jgi:F0F1-type ATP synthase membrane subunit b/b'